MSPPLSPLGISLSNLAVLQQQRPPSVPQPTAQSDGNAVSDSARGQQPPTNGTGRGRLVDILA